MSDKKKDQIFLRLSEDCKELRDLGHSVLFLVGDDKNKASIVLGNSKTISMILGSELVENEELLETIEYTVEMVKQYKNSKNS